MGLLVAFHLLLVIILMPYSTGVVTAKKNKNFQWGLILRFPSLKRLQYVIITYRIILKRLTNLKEQWNFKEMYQNLNSKLEKIS